MYEVSKVAPRVLYVDSRSGMLAFPEDWPEKRYNACNEPCDMLVGPCCCGATHYSCEEWVVELLIKKNAIIATGERPTPFVRVLDSDPVYAPGNSPRDYSLDSNSQDGDYLCDLLDYLQTVAREPVSLTFSRDSFGISIQVSTTYLLPPITVSTGLSISDIKTSRLDLVRLYADRNACTVQQERLQQFKHCQSKNTSRTI